VVFLFITFFFFSYSIILKQKKKIVVVGPFAILLKTHRWIQIQIFIFDMHISQKEKKGNAIEWIAWQELLSFPLSPLFLFSL
jgi:hypothetical protein